jgi:phytoene dehydrogenase-like protein
MAERFDVVVIGAGAGGLGAGLAAAEAGARVLVCEALTYPGGCASTFSRKGYRFDAGATLSAGLGEGQLLRTWLERYGHGGAIEALDPVLTVKAPGLEVAIPRDRAAFAETLAALPGVPGSPLRRFLDLQRRVADALWHVIDRPHLLPPLDGAALLAHARRSPRLLPVARWAGRPLLAVLRRFGLHDCTPVRTVVDALCQITVQCTSEAAEAPFALAALDYPFRGTGHVRGGIGGIAQGLVAGIRHQGGEVRFASRVKRLWREAGGWRLQIRRGEVQAPVVLANVLPGALADLAGDDLSPRGRRRMDRLQDRVGRGWGAAVLYLGIDAGADLPEHAHHVEIVQEPGAPLAHGNHLLVSLGDARDVDRAPPGERTVTVSTHLDPSRFDDEDPAQVVQAVQDRLRAGLRAHLPRLAEAIRTEMPGSPRTFARFTRRSGGFVGGVPRRVGLAQYLDVLPRPVAPGLWLVGDSVLLGQSVLAAATGGHRTAVASTTGSTVLVRIG